MLNAGLAVDAALRSLEQQTRHPQMLRVVNRLCRETEKGNPMSTGCLMFPRIFDAALVGMIQAGEAGGRLAETLEELAILLERRLRLRRGVQLAMIYPAIVLVMAVALGTLMTLFVLPRVEEMYVSMDAELPRLTQVLLSGKQHLGGLALTLVCGVLLLVLGVGFMRRNPRGRIRLDWLVLYLPGFAGLNRKLVAARFARACGQLLRSGVPILRAMELAGDVTGNRIAAQALLACRDRIEQGEQLSATLRSWRLFPPTLSQMLEAGESSGRMDDMLLKVADYFDREVRSAVTTLTVIMIPLVLLILGALVAGVVLAVLMPIFQLPAVITV